MKNNPKLEREEQIANIPKGTVRYFREYIDVRTGGDKQYE